MVSNYDCLPHFLGRRVADCLLSADPNSKATDRVPSHIALANFTTFHRPDGIERQIIEVIEVLQHRAAEQALH